MDAQKSADKLRRAAERDLGPDTTKEPGPNKTKVKERREADAESAEAHPDLTEPELSKGRPPARDGSKSKRRPSNAGTDGP